MFRNLNIAMALSSWTYHAMFGNAEPSPGRVLTAQRCARLHAALQAEVGDHHALSDLRSQPPVQQQQQRAQQVHRLHQQLAVIRRLRPVQKAQWFSNLALAWQGLYPDSMWASETEATR